MSEPQDPRSDVAQRTEILVARLREGGAEAGALLDQLYRDALVRFCWGYLGRIEEAEDAAQDVCYKVLTAEVVPDAFRTWLYKTARNHCLNLRRDRARRKDVAELPGPSQLHDVLTGHLTRMVRVEEQSRLAALIRELPEAEQEVLRLRYAEGLSRGEIAGVLDVAESVVKSRLFDGLRRLREQAARLDGG